MAKTASGPMPNITPAPWLNHILGATTTAINQRTLHICVRFSTPAITRQTALQPRGDSVVLGRRTPHRGLIKSALSYRTPSQIESAVVGDAQLPRFDSILVNSSGSALQWPCLGRIDAGDPLPLSLVDFSSRRPKMFTTSSPAQCVVGGTFLGNWH